MRLIPASRAEADGNVFVPEQSFGFDGRDGLPVDHIPGRALEIHLDDYRVFGLARQKDFLNRPDAHPSRAHGRAFLKPGDGLEWRLEAVRALENDSFPAYQND